MHHAEVDGSRFDWNDLKLVLALHRSGSMTRASRALGISQSSVSRRLAGLERALGARLFERTAGGIITATSTNALVARAEVIEQMAQELTREVAGLDTLVRGVVRVALPEALGVYGVIPTLGALRRRYPELQLEILPGTAPVDLVRNEAEIAVRFGRPVNPDLVARELGPIEFAAFVARASPWRRRKIDEVPWISWDRGQAALPVAMWLERTFPAATIALRTSTLIGIVAGAKAELGAALLPRGVAERAGGLVEISTGRELMSSTLYLVSHQAHRSVARVQAVREFLREQFELGTRPAEQRGRRTRRVRS
jgi:DNA-binding transcriptional LysR family regulator